MNKPKEGDLILVYDYPSDLQSDKTEAKFLRFTDKGLIVSERLDNQVERVDKFYDLLNCK